jgi:hypothetical protein
MAKVEISPTGMLLGAICSEAHQLPLEALHRLLQAAEDVLRDFSRRDAQPWL